MCPAAADSFAFRFAVYNTYDKAHPPETRPPGKRTGGYVLDQHAELARNCWVYPIVSRFPDEDPYVPYELKIDPDGVVQHVVGKPKLHLPTRLRPKELKADPNHRHHFKFSEKIDENGRPQVVRLFFCPFRLGPVAIEELLKPKYSEGRSRYLPYLWDWSTEKTNSPLRTATGLYLDESLTYLTIKQEDGSMARERVWVGFNPFHNAQRRSEEFVQVWRAHATQYEANSGNIDEWRKSNFVEMLYEAIYTNTKVPEKYRAALNTRNLNVAYDAFNEPRTASRRRVTQKAKRLREMLQHPFFSLVQYASYQPAEIPKEGQPESVVVDPEAVASHLQTLALVTRNLEDHSDGAAVLNQWVAESASTPHHFVNYLLFPDQSVPEDILKTGRLVSKSTFTAASAIFSRVIALRNKTAEEVAFALFRVGIFESSHDALQAIKQHTLSIDDLHSSLHLIPEGRKFSQVDLLNVERAHQIQAWLEKDQDSDLPVLNSVSATRKAAFLFLDLINVALSYKAFRDATTDDARTRAGLSTAAGSTFLAVSLTEFMLDRGNDATWKSAPESTRVWRVLTVAKSAAAVLYGVSDFLTAVDALQKGEKTRGKALLVAAAAEGVSAGIYLVQAVVGAPVFGGFLAAVAVVAAVAYLVAAHTSIDPLEHFLKNCEYGATPYDDGDYHRRWTGKKIGDWKGDFRTQTRAFIRVLTGFAMSWNRTAATPAMLRVLIECRRRDPGTRITVTFVADFPSKPKQSKRVRLHYGDLPDGNGSVAVDCPIDFIARGAERVTVYAKIELTAEGHEDQLAAVLWASPASGSPDIPDIHRVSIAD